jgi:hypothetical protein
MVTATYWSNGKHAEEKKETRWIHEKKGEKEEKIYNLIEEETKRIDDREWKDMSIRDERGKWEETETNRWNNWDGSWKEGKKETDKSEKWSW